MPSPGPAWVKSRRAPSSHPLWVPQLGDAAAVFDGITRRKEVVYSALVPNERGLARAVEARADKVSLFTAASETFNRKNINTSLAGSLKRFFTGGRRRPIVSGCRCGGYVSTAFWCAFEGRIAPEAVIHVVESLMDMGVSEVSISRYHRQSNPG